MDNLIFNKKSFFKIRFKGNCKIPYPKNISFLKVKRTEGTKPATGVTWKIRKLTSRAIKKSINMLQMRRGRYVG